MKLVHDSVLGPEEYGAIGDYVFESMWSYARKSVEL